MHNISPAAIDALVRDKNARVHFVGIGGTGMSAYADFRALSGAATSGSDRGFDAGRNLAQRDGFASRGIQIFPQDGSGVAGAAAIVVSAAIEKTVPDYASALDLGLPIITRPEWLAAHYRAYPCIAITGTSGKSTVTAMVFEILRGLGHDPGLIAGADLKSLLAAGLPGNAHAGVGPLVIEADESDKGIQDYTPEIGVILNLQRDHDEPENMLPAFAAFAKNCRRVCVVSDDPALATLRAGAVMFGVDAPAPYRLAEIVLHPHGSDFTFGGHPVHLNIPGRHNVDNAAAALATGLAYGLDVPAMARVLEHYQGVARRFDLVAVKNGVRVIDDYAHNPVKIAAVLRAAQGQASRVLVCYQPHGFGPTRFMRPDLVAMFTHVLRPDDRLYVAPIYYVGGTAAQDISSADLVSDLHARGITNVTALSSRDDFLEVIKDQARPGDVILIVGGRDPLLPAFARDVAAAIRQQSGFLSPKRADKRNLFLISM